MTRLLPLALILAASPAWAQRTELAWLGGYTTSGDIDQRAAGVEALAIDGSFTWGLEAGRLLTPHLGAEISWRHQQSALELSTSSGSVELFEMSVAQLHGNLAYQFGGEGGALRPFVFAGLGATFFGAEDLEGETKFAWDVGGGLKWYPGRRFGARFQVRYNPTQLSDEGSDFCDPFGFCQGSLQQFELMGGISFRF